MTMKDRFSISSLHPILKGHQVKGQGMLPGLAYIDLLMQLFQRHGHDPLCATLRDLTIYRPLVARPGENVMVEVSWDPVTPGVWRVTVEGPASGLHERVCHAAAEMHLAAQPPKFIERLDLDRIKAAADRSTDLANIYARWTEQGLVHDAFMRSVGELYEGTGEAVAVCAVGEEARPGASGLLFHPALIDGSAIAMTGVGMQAQPELHLPVFCESFSACAPVQHACIVRMDLSLARNSGEVRYATLEFFNDAGRKVAELTNLAAKRVREPSLEDAPVSAAPAASLLPAGSSSTVAENFLREVLAQRLQVSAQGIDVHAGYYELGLNSLSLMEVVQSIAQRVGTSLSPTLLFEYATVSSLAVHLTQHYGDHFDAAPAVPATPWESPLPAASRPLDGADDADVKAIAIVGMSGRFPQSDDIAAFWDKLVRGVDCIEEIPTERWAWQQMADERSPSGKPMSRWGGFIRDVDCFDAPFFRISPREAEALDPQERLFLQESWAAIEDSGYTPASLAGEEAPRARRRVGVFAGVMHRDYTLLAAEANARGARFPVTLSQAGIANRVSFACGFHGPSLTVDTMCSSSLVAVHLAVQSLRRGECAVAIAGGVNLSLHPTKYLMYGRLDMQSSDGRCRAFGEGGDGYVSAEGVAAVVLKPLSQAVADGDHVYAVIRGSATNHVGGASGFTVPSPQAQADVVVAALQDSGIDAATIGCVEAHGTGTSLGDPIEIQGLVSAFRQFTNNSHYCAIGSVKSNIGHAESAAGVCGLIKLALQLDRRMLVPSLHSQAGNPNIDLAETPFVLQHRVQPWEQPYRLLHGTRTPHPRRAGLSSVGATGSNVHLVLEEHLAEAMAPREGPVLVVLSARDEERLKACAQRLLTHVKHAEPSLADLAYTLQVGRVALESRWACVVASGAELLRHLQALAEGKRANGAHQGRVRFGNDLSSFSSDDDTREMVRKWVAGGKLAKLAELWVKGLAIDWPQLHAAGRPRRISLPSYPFEKLRYWVPAASAEDVLTAGAAGLAWLHPLLHRNTSDLHEQRFSTTLTGEEFFLRDHVVQGHKVLPGVAHLEMAREAVRQAVGGLGPSVQVGLKGVVFARPVVVPRGETLQLNIALQLHADDRIGFEIFSGEDEGATVHSQGTAVLKATEAQPQLDIETLQAQCSHGLDAPACYAAFARAGLNYGPAMQALQQVQSGAGQALARLVLPAPLTSSHAVYGLHPSLMDAALQAGVGMALDPNGAVDEGALLLPFALEGLQQFAPLPAEAWAAVRQSTEATNATFRKLDIDVADDAGRVCVRLSGFTTREATEALAGSDGTNTVLTFQEQWDAQALPVRPATSPSTGAACVVCVVPAGRQALYVQAWGAGSPPTFIDLPADDAHACADVLRGVARQQGVIDTLLDLRALDDPAVLRDHAAVATLVQGLAASGAVCRKMLIAGHCRDAVERCHLDARIGFERSLRLVLPDTQMAVIGGDDDVDVATWMLRLQAELQLARVRSVFYEGRQRQVLRLHATQVQAVAPLLRRGGTYLVTGGLGGLGWLFAEHLARVHAANIVLTGRAALDAEKTVRLAALEIGGGKALYFQADVCDAQRMAEVLAYAREQLGPIHGVIHAAGVVARHSVLETTRTAFEGVLAAKVAGSQVLASLLQGETLDFLCLFSSTAALLGDFGACSYAVGNRFQAALARWAPAGCKVVAIQWPLWEAGGMQVGDPSQTERYLSASGQAAMAAHEGLALFEQLVAQPSPQHVVFFGQATRIERFLNGVQGIAEDDAQEAVPAAPTLWQQTLPTSKGVEEKIARHLVRLLASTLKLPAHQIDTQVPMERYGIDSVMVMELTNVLERDFGVLSKTLFFEHQTIAALAGYFLQHHRARLIAMLDLEPPAAPTRVSGPTPALAIPKGRATRRRLLSTESPRIRATGDIAVIGISGRYPNAANLHDYWRNLLGEVDCITEVPPERWDHSRYYDPGKGKPGKTYAKWGGFINGIDRFDPLFFNISPAEAVGIDPQERLFLQTVYETLEDSGYTRERLGARVGVYVGAMYEEYQLYAAQSQLGESGYVVGGNISSIANRVSYWFNFHGPSLAVDTMCSSSLTALHLACRSLAQGDCDTAVAGGVNLSLHPNKFMLLGQGHFASTEGLCRSFGAGGDGYVPGEGVGAVLLKPLAQALQDGDQVYGVIKASSVNHGGKTNGYTVPNPNAQGELIAQAIEEAGVHPRAISYIEAHGTGTALGDPIEIAGLAKAFGAHTQDRQYCAIGSAKSNIGHCESAAGIAGLTKVLLQMKHGLLAKSLHSEALNPHIDFSQTPFVVQQHTTAWQRPVIDGREQPRIAGISSFGAGGANAHLIVQEHVDQRPAAAFVGPVIVVLSARDEERLRALAQRLKEAVQADAAPALADLAYTLQVGREAMAFRLACVVHSLDELRDRLADYLEGRPAPSLYTGDAGRGNDVLGVFSAQEELQEAVDKWLQRGKLEPLAKLWAQGLAVDWRGLYRETCPRRISLPTYPFASERYWPDAPRLSSQQPHGWLHPLLHRNTSNFDEQRFTTWLSTAAFCLRDHVVRGQNVLPGAAQLEMARAAIEQSVGPVAIRLEGVVFARPVVVDERGLELHIGLQDEGEGGIVYEIYSMQGGDEVLHGQGRAVLDDPAEARHEDLSALEAQSEALLSGPQCYAAFEQSGLRYGAGFRGLHSVRSGCDAAGAFLLGALALPAAVVDTQGDYVLHPSLLDAALQASIGLAAGDAGKTWLPFALEGLEVMAPLPAQARVVIRHCAGSSASGTVRKLDLHIVNANGQVCVRLLGFSSRLLEADTAPRTETLLFQPDWQTRPAQAQVRDWQQHHVVLCGVVEPGPLAAQVHRLSEAGDIAQRYADNAAWLLRHLQAVVNAKPQGQVLIQLVVHKRTDAALAGMLKSAMQENPRLVGQLVQIEDRPSPEELAQRLQTEAQCAQPRVRYAEGQRQVCELAPCEPADPSHETVPFGKDGGIYLITGGAGGLGLIFAQALAGQARNLTLVLTGRSVLSAQRRAALEALQDHGVRVDYRPVDVGDADAVQRLVQDIRTDYGDLHGVIHAAGVLRDGLLPRKSEQELREVFKPKVEGLVHLDWATQDVALDWFIAFSSASAVLGNVGQADYAAANAFMDEFMQLRQGRRPGRSLSLNWPLWEDGGMQVDATARQWMQKTTGLSPLPTQAGIDALHAALAGAQAQVLVLCGERSRISLSLAHAPASAPGAAEPKSPKVEGGLQLQPGLESTLKQMVSRQLKIAEDRLGRHTDFSEFGFNSISLTEFANQLGQRYGLRLAPTVFFEYPTLSQLSGYLAQAHAGELSAHFAAPAADEHLSPAHGLRSTVQPAMQALRAKQRQRGRATPAAHQDAIAIIGVSGRYPQADNVDALWKNLLAGKDCVAEIPQDRWSLEHFYCEDKEEALRTNRSYSKFGSFIEGLKALDGEFFGLSATESALMGPRELLFLQTAWTLLESAGYTRESLRTQHASNVGVYVGVTPGTQHYFGHDSPSNPPLPPVSISMLAHRVSAHLDLAGPSIAIDTQSASSMTAVHMACEALRSGDCEMAIAGGVCLLYPELFVLLGHRGALGSRFDSRSFREGDGLILAEGAGAVLLKPLSRAVADGDEVLAVVRASGINHAGRGSLSSAPSLNAQARLIGDVIARAKVDARSISYVESAAYGSPMGDAIEVAALAKAFRAHTSDTQFCAIGSVKSHLGHAEAASGIMQLTKLLMQLRHRTMVPLLGSESVNPGLDLAATPFYLPGGYAAWQRPRLPLEGREQEVPRRALVNSFGAGGAYASVLIEEYIAPAPIVMTGCGPQLVVLSAKTPRRLRVQARQLLDFIAEGPPLDAPALADLAYTLQVGREALDARLALLVSGQVDLTAGLQQFLGHRHDRTVDLFTGEVVFPATMADPAANEVSRDMSQDLVELARGWVGGRPVRWSVLHPPQGRRRIPIPTDPFGREEDVSPTGSLHQPVAAARFAAPPGELRSHDAVARQRASRSKAAR
jgi:polyketide synthase PksN